MKTLLICHEDADLVKVGMARWLASFSDLTGIVVLHEPRQRVWRRVRREIRRIGLFRFFDVLAFRLYYRLVHARSDEEVKGQMLAKLCEQYPGIPATVPVLITSSPNSAEAAKFMAQQAPDFVFACCKTLLKKEVLALPAKATLVLHPGICPEYRNAHGCFWALANNDLKKVGMTLLTADEGIDTGRVYGYYTYDFDELKESHVIIQSRVVFENLEPLRQKITELYCGTAVPIVVEGRPSAEWGQPWLTKHLKWKRNAARRKPVS